MILDTNAVSALFAGATALDDVLARRSRHHLPVVVIGEYRFGILRSRSRSQLESAFTGLIRESIILGVDETTAEIYARVKDELRTKGLPIPANDVWIAALALQHDQPVVSRDEHFDSVSGVARIGW